MLNENDFQEIKECEDAGIDVVVISNDGKLNYSTKGLGGSEFCDQCEAFRLLPDPDPYDGFRDGDMKAVCLSVNGVIAGALERPSEWTNIDKPLYCPKLGRRLDAEEKKRAQEDLNWAQARME